MIENIDLKIILKSTWNYVHDDANTNCIFEQPLYDELCLNSLFYQMTIRKSLNVFDTCYMYIIYSYTMNVHTSYL